MFNHYPPHHADIRGLRPHWLRIAILLLLVVGVFWLPQLSLTAGNPAKLPPAQWTSPDTRPSSEAPVNEQRAVKGEFVPLDPAPVYQAIDRANQAFQAARAQASLAPLEGIAIGDWLAYEQDQIDMLRSSGTTQRWTLLPSSYIGEPNIQGTQATVCAREYWQRNTINADGTVAESETKDYIQQYVLQLVGNTWLVSHINYDSPAC